MIGTTMKKLRPLTPVLALGLILSGCSLLNIFENVTVVAQTSSLSYPIVDTGQELTYGNTTALATEPGVNDPFFGQDAQVDGNQPSYQLNGDGTVTDLVTSLMWTQDYYGKMTASEAEASVASFSLAGHDDWRLPTVKELYSLIDFSGVDVGTESGTGAVPFINTSVFDFAYGDTAAGERIIDSQWLTTTLYTGSTQFAGGAQLMFGVNFADGRIKGYPVGSSLGPGGSEKTYFVRYVRGNTSYGENDFVDNGNGTISDLATGLMWAQTDSGATMNWEEALAFVVSLNNANYLGYSDWYLPNAKELQSIVDYNRSPDATNSAAIDPLFSCTPITNEAGQLDWGYYWTSTTHASARGGQNAVYIAFGRGLGYMNGQFMDVHGAGCQRSDPKTGSPSYGNAPQGDVVRVTNLVRVTRSIEGTIGSTPSMVAEVAATGSATSSDASLGSTDSPNSNLAVDDSTTGVAASSEQDSVLFAPLSGEAAYLIDRKGDLVHTWALAGRPGNSVYLLEGGDLLATYTVSGHFAAGGLGGGVERLTWDGETVWSFELATDHAHLHHDVEMLPNGNVLLISWEAKTRAEALAAGLRPNQLPASGEVWSEMILEYDPALDEIVWEWHLWDHALPFGEDPTANPNKIDLGFASNRQSSDWWHFNAVDYSAELDQIVISSRAASEIWILDHDLTTSEAEGEAGDLLYRTGNPSAYGASGERVLYGQHDAKFITDELPSEGNSSGTAGDVRILVFDNGDPKLRPYSRVLELDLPNYGASLSSRVLPAQVVWQYPSDPGGPDAVWFADHISGAQRLESGNTLICSGTEGRFFEVTPEGNIVWEYVNPFTSVNQNGKESNEVFRCEGYSAAYIGHDLSTSSDTSLAQSNSQGTGIMTVPGINSIVPTSIAAGITNQLVAITLNPQFAPPVQVQFSSVAIRPSWAGPNSQATGVQVADIQATSWNRSGLSIQAWFLIPESTAPGDYQLNVTFPSRSQEPITFSHPVSIN